MAVLEPKTPGAFWGDDMRVLTNTLGVDLGTPDTERIQACARAAAGTVVGQTGHDWTADKTIPARAELAWSLIFRQLYYSPDAFGDPGYSRDFDFSVGAMAVVEALQTDLAGGWKSSCGSVNFPEVEICPVCGQKRPEEADR